MSKKNLLICFDAFGTLFTPRKPVAQQYSEVARSFGLGGFSDDDIAQSFKKAFKHESKTNPNYGKKTGMGAEKWWGNVSLFQSSEETTPSMWQNLNVHCSENALLLKIDITTLKSTDETQDNPQYLRTLLPTLPNHRATQSNPKPNPPLPLLRRLHSLPGRRASSQATPKPKSPPRSNRRNNKLRQPHSLHPNIPRRPRKPAALRRRTPRAE